MRFKQNQPTDTQRCSASGAVLKSTIFLSLTLLATNTIAQMAENYSKYRQITVKNLGTLIAAANNRKSAANVLPDATGTGASDLTASTLTIAVPTSTWQNTAEEMINKLTEKSENGEFRAVESYLKQNDPGRAERGLWKLYNEKCVDRAEYEGEHAVPAKLVPVMDPVKKPADSAMQGSDMPTQTSVRAADAEYSRIEAMLNALAPESPKESYDNALDELKSYDPGRQEAMLWRLYNEKRIGRAEYLKENPPSQNGNAAPSEEGNAPINLRPVLNPDKQPSDSVAKGDSRTKTDAYKNGSQEEGNGSLNTYQPGTIGARADLIESRMNKLYRVDDGQVAILVWEGSVYAELRNELKSLYAEAAMTELKERVGDLVRKMNDLTQMMIAGKAGKEY